MEYQVDTSNHRTQEVRIGRNNQEVAVFRKANFLIHNLKAQVEGTDYQMKLAAPWNKFRYQLRQGQRELASAKKNTRMHAFEADRPLIRHPLAEFDLDVAGQPYKLTPIDRHGLTFILEQAGNEIGRLSRRSFEAQRDAQWKADLSVPDNWSEPLGAFVAWIAREGYSRIST